MLASWIRQNSPTEISNRSTPPTAFGLPPSPALPGSGSPQLTLLEWHGCHNPCKDAANSEDEPCSSQHHPSPQNPIPAQKTKQVRSYSSLPLSLSSTTWLYLQLYPYLVLILLRECNCCEFVVLEEEILIDQEIDGFLVHWFNGLLLTQGHHALIDLFCGP